MKKNLRIKSASGFGLIEVLVTLFILSTSLLALAALQTRSLQFNQGAYLRSQANIYAYDIFDRMRLNVDNIAAYEIASAPFPLTTVVAAAPLAAADLDAWRMRIASNLPNGQGGIDCDAADTHLCTVTIRWDELNATGKTSDDRVESEDKTEFSYTARL
jgi:type IV pilus assembly protein PilV